MTFDATAGARWFNPPTDNHPPRLLYTAWTTPGSPFPLVPAQSITRALQSGFQRHTQGRRIALQREQSRVTGLVIFQSRQHRAPQQQPSRCRGGKGSHRATGRGEHKRGRRSSDHRDRIVRRGARVHEREQAAEWLDTHGFLAGSENGPQHATFLFATSAGEVGVDLDADHMVCDLVEWERMVQRLGRVNRRGNGDGAVRVIVEGGSH